MNVGDDDDPSFYGCLVCRGRWKMVDERRKAGGLGWGGGRPWGKGEVELSRYEGRSSESRRE